MGAGEEVIVFFRHRFLFFSSFFSLPFSLSCLVMMSDILWEEVMIYGNRESGL